MKVTVITGEWARRYIPRERSEENIPEGLTAGGLLERLPIPTDDIGIIAVNGRAVRREDILCDGDIVKLFPKIIGG